MPYLKFELPKVKVTVTSPPIGYRTIGDNKVFAYTDDVDLAGLDWLEIIVIQDIKLVPWALTFGKTIELHIPDNYDNDSDESKFASKKLEISKKILTDAYKIPANQLRETIEFEMCTSGDLFNYRGTMTPRIFVIHINR